MLRRGYANTCHASLPGMGLKPSYLDATGFQPFPDPSAQRPEQPRTGTGQRAPRDALGEA